MNINRDYVSEKNTYSRVNARKYIVIHETDNFKKGADGLAHAKAQSNGNLSTSVHFYCGSDGIYQVAELDKSTWSIGRTYKEDRPIMDATNYNTINIEICVNEDGDYEVARQNAIDLVKYLMKELNLSADRVIRHYDAKGKYCPRKMMDNPKLWTSFKEAIEGKTETKVETKVEKVSDTKMPTIKLGAKGKAVGVWQVIVGAEVDEDFGSKTKAKTIEFQKKAFPNDENEWDGVVGPKTWKAGLESL
jgi:N-acetylmuramoyl-L-alanine amidase CwlA